MKKLFVTLTIVLLAIFASSAAFAATPQDAPEKITLDDCVKKKSAVEFPHKLHFDSIDCTTCHHTQEGLTAEATTEVETCTSCHLTPEKPETPACSEMSSKKNPYHISCVGCHKDTVKADATKKLPVKCDECHPKA